MCRSAAEFARRDVNVAQVTVEPMRDRVRTRGRILAATEELLSEQSARDLRVRDIAARAGVSASLVVQYFVSKDALVLDVGLRRLAAFETPPTTSGLHETVAAMVRTDLANAALLREVMRQSWWWPRATERAFQSALAPRRAAIQSAAPHAKPAQVEAAVCRYFDQLRASLIEDINAKDCAAAVTSAVLAILTTPN